MTVTTLAGYWLNWQRRSHNVLVRALSAETQGSAMTCSQVLEYGPLGWHCTRVPGQHRHMSVARGRVIAAWPGDDEPTLDDVQS